jgi:hypothetical protein
LRACGCRGDHAGFVNTFFEDRLNRLFDLAEMVKRIFSSAGLEYRVVGGVATYLYVEELEPDAGRLTKDIDVAARAKDETHVNDLDEAGALTPEVQATLSPVLAERLARVRARR